MAIETKLILNVDSTQAQRSIKLVDDQLNGLGKGKSVKPEDNLGGVEKFGEVQERFIDSFNKYIENTEKLTRVVVSRMDQMETYMKKSFSSDADNIYQKKLKELEAREKMINVGSKSKNSKSSSENSSGSNSNSTKPSVDDTLKQLLTKVAGVGTAITALNGVTGYHRAGAQSSQRSSLQAYDIYNTIGYDGSFSKIRDQQASLGAEYGFDVSSTLGVQRNLIGMTGATSPENIKNNTNSALRASRALSVDEGQLSSTFGKYYQTGTYDAGGMSRFANLFATSISESGMTGRENEQLEVLESINKLLDKNLTTVTENQYKNTLGLYSLFSTSSQGLSGAKSANLVDSLNTAITSGGNGMDIALGKYSGRFKSMWDFEKQKEKGISDPDNMASILDYFENTMKVDLESDKGKQALQKFFQDSGSKMSTEEIETLVKNRANIQSKEYADTFSDSVDSGNGDKIIGKEINDYTKDKLSKLLGYDAESSNAKERAGDTFNSLTSGLKGIYNNLPPGLQSLIGAGGAAIGGVAGSPLVQGAVGNWAYGKVKSAGGFKGIFNKVSGKTGNMGNFDDYAVDILDAMNDPKHSTKSVEELLKRFSKDGKVTEDMLDWADDLTDIYNKGSDPAKIIEEGYKKYGKAFKSSSSSDNIAKAVGESLDEVAEAVSGAKGFKLDGQGMKGFKGIKGGLGTLSKGGKLAGVLGTAIEVGTTAYDAFSAFGKGDIREAAQEIGGGIGSIAGGYGGATAGAAGGAALGSVVPIVGTAAGGIIGALAGGIGGSVGGNKLGELLGETVYDVAGSKPVFSEEENEKIKEYYNEVSKLYNEKGNNAAQKYTNDVVSPYLNSIGISTSVTDKYIKDVGRPDFMKDYEKNAFGTAISNTQSYKGLEFGGSGASFGDPDKSKKTVDSNTSAIEENTITIDNLQKSLTNSKIVTSKEKESDVSLVTNNKTISSTPTLMSRFKNMFGISGSHAVGLDYVPYDGYLAELHKGETILDAHNAKEYRNGSLGSSSGDSSKLEINITGSIAGMTPENQSMIVSAVVQRLNSQQGQRATMNQLAFNTVRVAN